MDESPPSHGRRLALQGLAAIGVAGLPWLAHARTTPESQWVLEIVHTFDGDNDGYQSPGDLCFGPDGMIYGVNPVGGLGGLGAGNVYRCSPADGSLTVLSQFFDSEDLPGSPDCGVVLASDGRLWGTSFTGGHLFRGTVYTVTLDGLLELQAEFADENVGDVVFGGVIEARPGRFYGTTYRAVYRLDTRTAHDRGLKALHRFDPKMDGDGSSASLTDGADGWLYGCNPFKGPKGHGTLFRVAIHGGAFEVLKVFDGGDDGSGPGLPLLRASDGAFYGCTSGGGLHGLGVAFRLAVDGGFSVLHHFSGGRHDGAIPTGGLCEGPDGALYGCTHEGGGTGHDAGTVFRLTRRGRFSLLHHFKFGQPEGYDPHGRLTFGPDGKLYGTTRFGAIPRSGSLFRLAPPAP